MLELGANGHEGESTCTNGCRCCYRCGSATDPSTSPRPSVRPWSTRPDRRTTTTWSGGRVWSTTVERKAAVRCSGRSRCHTGSSSDSRSCTSTPLRDRLPLIPTRSVSETATRVTRDTPATGPGGAHRSATLVPRPSASGVSRARHRARGTGASRGRGGACRGRFRAAGSGRRRRSRRLGAATAQRCRATDGVAGTGPAGDGSRVALLPSDRSRATLLRPPRRPIRPVADAPLGMSRPLARPGSRPPSGPPGALPTAPPPAPGAPGRRPTPPARATCCAGCASPPSPRRPSSSC